MNEWKSYQLGELLTFISKGTTPPKGVGFADKGVNYIKAESIDNRRIDISKLSYITPELHNFYKRSQLKEDDILFSMAGYLGKNTVIKKSMLPANTNQAIAILRVNSDMILPNFLSYYLSQQHMIEYINNMSAQSVQPNINFQEIKSIPILAPNLKEQRVILDVLSSLDDKIELFLRQNITLIAMARSLFRQWFVEEEEDWPMIKIKDVADLNKQTRHKNYPFAEIQYLDTGSITDGNIDKLQIFSISDAPSRAQRLVSHNDIVISMVRPNQRHYGIIQYPIENMVVSTGFVVLTCKNISPYFLFLLLTSPDMTEFLHSIAESSTSAYPALKPSDISDIIFKCPPKEKLDKFNECAASMWKKINYNQTQIRTLEKLRDTLLPKLMSGEVRVSLD